MHSALYEVLAPNHRNQLKCDLIEVLELLRKWYGTPEKRLMKNKDGLRLRWIYSIRKMRLRRTPTIGVTSSSTRRSQKVNLTLFTSLDV
jgi:hypothetical protein